MAILIDVLMSSSALVKPSVGCCLPRYYRCVSIAFTVIDIVIDFANIGIVIENTIVIRIIIIVVSMTNVVWFSKSFLHLRRWEPRRRRFTMGLCLLILLLSKLEDVGNMQVSSICYVVLVFSAGVARFLERDGYHPGVVW